MTTMGMMVMLEKILDSDIEEAGLLSAACPTNVDSAHGDDDDIDNDCDKDDVFDDSHLYEHFG